MSTLRTALRDYLALQRGLGYKYVHQERTLTNCIRHSHSAVICRCSALAA